MLRSLTIHFFVQFVHEQGTYFRFHNLARALVDRGHSVKVFGCDNHRIGPKRTEIRDKVVYHIIPSFRGQSVLHPFNHPLNAIAQIPAALESCDVAHLFQPFASAALAWKLSRAKVLFYDWDDLWHQGLHNTPPSNLSGQYFQRVTALLEANLPRCADGVTVCSTYLKRLALGRSAKQVKVLVNGVFPLDLPTQNSARNTLGLQQDAVYLGFMGRTTREIGWCFDLLEMGKNSIPNLRLALCGPAPEALNALPSEVRNSVDYLGSLPSTEVPIFGTAINLGLIPLANDSFNRSRFPIKFAEHMNFGTPIVCSPVGECARIGKSMPWVYLAAAHGKDAWINAGIRAIRDLANQPAIRVDRTKVQEQLSWPSLAQSLEEYYIATLAQKHGTPLKPA